jgi:lauroyl/myristoyl acyltransferase
MAGSRCRDGRTCETGDLTRARPHVLPTRSRCHEPGPGESRAPAAAGAGRGTGRAKYLRANDLAMLAKLPLAALVAWTLPEPAWDRVAAAAAATSRRKAARILPHLEAFARGTELGAPVEAVVRGHARNVRLLQAQYLRCHRPRGWRPDVRLEGREHLDRALAAGHGAIVWVVPFVFALLVTKMALHAAGYGLVHLSRAEHGGSPTRFGVRVLNPVRVRAENRYLAERVVIGEGCPLGEAMRTLARRLAANRVVSITVGAQGAKTRAAPFLGGELRVATGAPSLALRTGAPLLPVFTVREGPGRFLTAIEPPLRADPGLGRERATQDLVADLVARTEGRARRWPDQFHWYDDVTGWRPQAG